jgi:hypothetical protein
MGFLIQPQFFFRYVRISEVLAKIGELLIDMPADVTAVNYPNLKIPAFIYQF